MKRFFIMALIAVCSVQMASAIDVWVSTGSSATKYHKTKECPGLNNTTATIKKVTESEAKNMGRTKCARCWTDAPKTAAKKTTTTKKTTPARDENGRFVKKDASEKATKKAKTTKKATTTKKETTAKKSTPARDANGRFVKKDAAEKATTTK